MQRAVRAAADVVRAPPVQELPAGCGGGEHLARGPAAQRGPDAAERVRVARGPHAAVARVEREHVEVAFHAPALPAQVGEVAARRETQLAAARADGRLAVRDGRSCASRGRRPPARASVRVTRGTSVARAGRGRAHKPARRASSGRPRSPRSAGLQLPHAARREARRTRRTPGTGRSRPRPQTASGREQTITAWSSRKASGPAGGVHQPLDLLVGGRERGDLAVRPVLVRVRVVVGQGEEHEVEQVVLDHVGADAARVLVAHARAGRAASGSRCGARRTGRRRRTPAGRRRAP